MQSNLAAGEIMPIDNQIQAAQVRVTIVQDDLNTHTAQVANAQQVQLAGDLLQLAVKQLERACVSGRSSPYCVQHRDDLRPHPERLADLLGSRPADLRGPDHVRFPAAAAPEEPRLRTAAAQARRALAGLGNAAFAAGLFGRYGRV